MSQPTPLQQFLQKLRSVFPEAVTETERRDEGDRPYYSYTLKDEFIEQLKEAGLDPANDKNRYELQFPGKQTAKTITLVPHYKTLVADKAQSKQFDDTGNVFIEGDNLDALRMLQTSYRGKIKMIYIDPPYNTGNDNFMYNDNFRSSQSEFLQAAGYLDEDGVRQIEEVQTGLKGRFHAGWLVMIYPRLKLARELLSEDGVIFISIDDNEQANLKLICDEIFGEENVDCFIWHKAGDGRYGKMKNTTTFRKDHEYVYVAYKNRQKLNKLWDYPNYQNDYDNPDKDPRGRYKAGSLSKKEETSKRSHANYYSVKSPSGKTFTRQFDMPKSEFQSLDEDNRIYWGKKGDAVPQLKIFLKEKRFTTPSSLLRKGSTSEGTSELGDILVKVDASAIRPKPSSLLCLLIQLATKQDSTVLDFFAGSATTADAVMQLNDEDGGNRKFIMVQLPEAIDLKKDATTYQFCTNELKRPATIAEIAKERIRRAGAKIAEQSERCDIDTGFRAFTIQDSLLSGGEKSSPLAETRQDELPLYITELKPENFDATLYEVLLRTGVSLDQPVVIGEIDNYPFAICGRYCYCITENLSQQIVQSIIENHGDSFDMLYYLNDALNATTSFTEIEAVIHQAPGGNKGVQGLAFY